MHAFGHGMSHTSPSYTLVFRSLGVLPCTRVVNLDRGGKLDRQHSTHKIYTAWCSQHIQHLHLIHPMQHVQDIQHTQHTQHRQHTHTTCTLHFEMNRAILCWNSFDAFCFLSHTPFFAFLQHPVAYTGWNAESVPRCAYGLNRDEQSATTMLFGKPHQLVVEYPRAFRLMFSRKVRDYHYENDSTLRKPFLIGFLRFRLTANWSWCLLCFKLQIYWRYQGILKKCINI